MFTPDDTHSTLFQAINGLAAARHALSETAWAANLLKLLATSTKVSPAATAAIVALITAEAPRIEALIPACALGEAAVERAVLAIETARGKIPNTTPADPEALEAIVHGTPPR